MFYELMVFFFDCEEIFYFIDIIVFVVFGCLGNMNFGRYIVIIYNRFVVSDNSRGIKILEVFFRNVNITLVLEEIFIIIIYIVIDFNGN